MRSEYRHDHELRICFKKVYLRRCMLSFSQSITTTDFQVCLKDIQRYDAYHDPVTLNYMAAGCKYAIIAVFMANLETVGQKQQTNH